MIERNNGMNQTYFDLNCFSKRWLKFFYYYLFRWRIGNKEDRLTLQNAATERYLAAKETNGVLKIKTETRETEETHWTFEIVDWTTLRLKFEQKENDFYLTALRSYAVMETKDSKNSAQKWIWLKEAQE